MTKFTIFSALAGSLFCSAAFAAPVPYIGVQFVVSGPSLASTDLAGEAPQKNFNAFSASQVNGSAATALPLNDAQANLSPVSLSATTMYGAGTYGYTSGTYAVEPNTDGALLNGQNKSFYGATYTLSGLPDGNSAYGLIVYIVNDQSSDKSGQKDRISHSEARRITYPARKGRLSRANTFPHRIQTPTALAMSATMSNSTMSFPVADRSASRTLVLREMGQLMAFRF